MGRYGKVGTFRQVTHPRIRGALDPSSKQKRYDGIPRLQDYQTDEETYFVPSFSIRRHLHRSEELLWDTNQKMIGRRLGRGFKSTPSTGIALKTIEQKRFIKNMREAGIHPDPDEIRDIAYSVRDMLTDLLTNAESPLPVPLGDLGRFGQKKNALAYQLYGWRGDRAQYGPNDHEGNMDPLAVILAERQLAVGALALAYGEDGLKTDGLAPSPHITIARGNGEIPAHRMREFRDKLADLAIDDVCFGDPVIDVKLHPNEPSEPIYIKHAWDSLALTA